MKKKIISGIMSAVMLMTCFMPISAAAADTTLPSSYGDTSKPTRHQEPWGSCWVFGSIATLESKIKHDENNDIDLSEEHVLLRTSKGDSSSEWNLSSKNTGGDFATALGYFMAGHGPALESEFPYDTNANNDITTVSTSVKDHKPTYRITETRNIPYSTNDDGTMSDTTINEIKKAVINNGGVLSTIYYYGAGSGKVTSPGAYYRSQRGTDHSVCIIGWNDNYPAENFGTSKVTSNGAFLARNSWGSEKGDNGYLWISYKSIDLMPIYSIESYEKPTSTENYYSLESVGANSITSNAIPSNGMIGYINVFNIQNEMETLEEVIFYLPDDMTEFDVDYKVYYMPVDSNGEPKTSAKKLIGSGTASQGGYYCIKATSGDIVAGKAAIMVSIKDAHGYAYMGQERTKSSGEYTEKYEAGQSFLYKEQNGSSAMIDVGHNYTIKLKTKTVDPSTIEKVDASEFTVTGLSSKTYTGSAIKPTVTVKYGTKTLKKDTDYTVTYSNNVNAGTAKVTITGKGLYYKGTITKTFAINKASASKFTVSSISNKTYTGKLIKPAVTVKYGKKTLEKDTDYTLVYKNNKYCGKATYTITGKGNYTGTKSGSFYIKPKQSTISSLTKAKKAFTVKMKNSSKYITGYQVAYKRSGGSYKYKTTTSSKLKVSKLSAKKYYYVKVRAYKKVGSTKIYGSWSKVKKVKTK